MKKLYVGNLAYATTDAGLKAFFETVTPVTSARIITDRETGRSRGFGFVEVENAEEALKINGQTLDGKTLTVNEAREMSAVGGGGGGPRREGGGGGGRSGTGGGGRSFGGGREGGGRGTTSYGSEKKRSYRGW